MEHAGNQCPHVLSHFHCLNYIVVDLDVTCFHHLNQFSIIMYRALVTLLEYRASQIGIHSDAIFLLNYSNSFPVNFVCITKETIYVI